MCGIAGWYRRNARPVTVAAIDAQCDTIFHRGPDDSGAFVDGDFGFGMRRLSILDIAGGHQPMSMADGRFVIVFNGEIYNHQDLRAQLGSRGDAFRTHSDTETILAAFLRWGNDVWPMLEGMFAVAIWDRAERELTLARDPLGIKPLYISEQRGGLAFASELRALQVLPEHEFNIDDRAVHDYFSFGHVRKPRSIYREVYTLDPGHFLTFSSKGKKVSKAFWSPRVAPQAGKSSAEWIEEMQSMLLGSVARHMQSDVPVAAFLSGGIDSSAVLAAMTRASGRPVKAFTIGYPGAKIDETAAAREIAQHLGCEHVVLPLELHSATEVLPAVQRCYDEPFADMAAIPTWYASKLAADHVKVVLCGEGGDELFAGYKRHRNAQNIHRLRPLINSAGPLGAVIDHLPVTSSARMNYIRQNAQRFAEFVRLPDGYQQFFAATQISRKSLRREVYSEKFWAEQEGENAYTRLEGEYFPDGEAGNLSTLQQFLYADLTVNMPSAMLTRLDRASMAHSVEARVPFLSHKLVDWALTVPDGLKLHGNVGKFILRKAIAPWLPPAILKRPKQGFQMPLASWLRGDFGDFAREAWNDSGAAGSRYLDPNAVERLFGEHRRGEADHGRMLYAITAFSLWWRNSRSGAAAAPSSHTQKPATAAR
jgi:asparagine synthase (glutamine-hydrolysing)